MKKIIAGIFVCFLLTISAGSFFVPATQAQFVQDPTKNPATETTNAFDTAVSIVNVLFAIVFIAALIGLVIAGLKFLSAGGSESVIGSAHSLWIASLVGVSISLLGYVIVNVIKYYFR